MYCYNTVGLVEELYLLLTSNKSASILIALRPLSLGVFVRQEGAAARSADSATVSAQKEADARPVCISITFITPELHPKHTALAWEVWGNWIY